MCRLAVIKKTSLNKINGDFFEGLEKSLGGHGNSITLINSNNVELPNWAMRIRKGNNFNIIDFSAINDRLYFNSFRKSNNDWNNVYQWLFQQDFEYLIFHTRLASTGGMGLFHPIETDNLLLWQNGTVRIDKWILKYFKIKSDWDTQQVAEIIEKTKSLSILYDKSSSWILFDKRTNDLYVIKNNSDLQFTQDLGIIASEIDLEDVYEFKGTIGIIKNFELIKGQIKKTIHYYSRNFYYDTKKGTWIYR